MRIDKIMEQTPYKVSLKTPKEIRADITVLNSAANKRIRNLISSNTAKKAGYDFRYNPALRSAAEQLGMDIDAGEIPRFTTPATTDIQKLRAAYRQVVNFLNAETSTIKTGKKQIIDPETGEVQTVETGAIAYQKKMVALIGDIANDVDFAREFWKGYNRFMVTDKFRHIYDSKQVVAWLRQSVEKKNVGLDRDAIYKFMRDEEKRQDMSNEEKFQIGFSGVSITQGETERKFI